MRASRLVRLILYCLLGGLLLLGTSIGSLWVYFHPQVHRTDGIIYGQRRGHALKLDILKPSSTNGIGILLLVSGGWKSGQSGSFQSWMAAPLLRRGYTVLPVYHVSQPEATVMEIAEDMHRAVRFVRHNAAQYGIDPGRLGVTGASAGGHLSLILATRGGPGSIDAIDPVDRQTSAVQAAAVFFPVTDLLNLGTSTENPGDGGPPKSFVRGFGTQATNLLVWKVIGRELSAIYFVSSNMPPVLILHGQRDTLVPLDQSTRFQAAGREAGAIVDLVIEPRAGHGWGSMVLDLRRLAKWFDRYLLKPHEPPRV